MNSLNDRNSTTGFYIIFVVVCLVYLANTGLLWGNIIDDAYISLRYAQNLAPGNGLGYKPDDRGEGYNKFLWVIIQYFSILSGINPVFAAKITGAISGLATLLLIMNWGGKWFGNISYFVLIPLFYLGTSGYFIYYSLSGMETNLYGFFLLLGIYFHILKPEGRGSLYSTISMLAASLTRPEGLLFATIILAAQGHQVYKSTITRSQWMINIFVYIILFSIYTGWRVLYFGSLLPNTYYVRMGKDLTDYFYTWTNGIAYIKAFMRNHCWLPLISLAATVLLRKYKGILFSGIFTCIYCLVIIFEGGDWMPFSRMLIPILPIFL